jgi:hypothetical protein
MIAIRRAAPGTSFSVCTIERPRPPHDRSVERRLSALVFDVLDERPQLGQDLVSARVVQKDPWRCGGKGRQ